MASSEVGLTRFTEALSRAKAKEGFALSLTVLSWDVGLLPSTQPELRLSALPDLQFVDLGTIQPPHEPGPCNRSPPLCICLSSVYLPSLSLLSINHLLWVLRLIQQPFPPVFKGNAPLCYTAALPSSATGLTSASSSYTGVRFKPLPGRESPPGST